MPMYSFTNFESGETIDRFFKIGEKPEFVTENEITYQYVLSAPAIVSGVGGMKVPSNLKDRLGQIKKQVPTMRSSVV